MTKKIDWDKVDKQSQRCLEICQAIEEEIAQERAKQTDIKDLQNRTEIVNNFIKENNLNYETLELNSKKRK